MTRRDFLRAGSLCGLTLSLPAILRLSAQNSIIQNNPEAKREKRGSISCIYLNLLGAPSHLDTWDMKPDAPIEFRGPFKPIKTNVPGIEISEIFPRMAQHADLFSIVRSVHYPEEAIAGLSFAHLPEIQAGYCLNGQEMDWHENDIRDFHQNNCSGIMSEGHSAAGSKAKKFISLELAVDLRNEPDAVREKYGHNRFGQSCLLARRLVERGVPFVTVNMHTSVLAESSWDCHGSAPFPALDAYRTHCGPMFDNGYTSLITELKARGLYDTTIVIAAGEFGRTPRLNRAGGRDHWPHCWSMILGGGGLRNGQIIGASDAIGAYPIDQPITPADLTATLHTALGIDRMTIQYETATKTIKDKNKDKNAGIASDSPVVSVLGGTPFTLKGAGIPISALL